MMLLERAPFIAQALRAADPSGAGFVSVYDFRQALYVDAAIDYDTVMKVGKEAPTSGGHIAYNVWLDTLSTPQNQPQRGNQASEETEKELNSDVRDLVKKNITALLEALRTFDADNSGYVTVYDFRRTVYLYLGISQGHADLLFRSIGYAENGFINYLMWMQNVESPECADLAPYFQASNPLLRSAVELGPDAEVMQPRLDALRSSLLHERARQKRGSGNPKLVEMDRFKHRLRETEEMKCRMTMKSHVADVRRSELETELRTVDLVLQDREYARRVANRTEEGEAMAAHTALRQQVHVVSTAPPVPENVAQQQGIRAEMGSIEERLNELNYEKQYMDHRAHDHQLRHLHTSHHAMQLPYLSGSDAHALYAGGAAALPPRSWLNASPMTRELLMTKIPAVQLEEGKMGELQTELEQLKKLNPAETIATLQRLNITSSEKLRLFRNLDLEAIGRVHPGGMLAHAKAGLPIHPREAEAQLVEQIRESHAPDIDKVLLIRDMPLSPSKKIELLSELTVR